MHDLCVWLLIDFKIDADKLIKKKKKIDADKQLMLRISVMSTTPHTFCSIIVCNIACTYLQQFVLLKEMFGKWKWKSSCDQSDSI